MALPEISDQDRIWYILKGYEIKIGPSGTREWYLNGKRHREDGPAMEYADGGREWYLNGERHREDGLPAVEYSDGHREWWVNGKRHREDGPAYEGYGGDKNWYLNDKEMTEEEHRIIVNEMKIVNT